MQTAAKSDVWYPLSQLGAVLWHLATQIVGYVDTWPPRLCYGTQVVGYVDTWPPRLRAVLWHLATQVVGCAVNASVVVTVAVKCFDRQYIVVCCVHDVRYTEELVRCATWHQR